MKDKHFNHVVLFGKEAAQPDIMKVEVKSAPDAFGIPLEDKIELTNIKHIEKHLNSDK